MKQFSTNVPVLLQMQESAKTAISSLKAYNEESHPWGYGVRYIKHNTLLSISISFLLLVRYSSL